MPMKLSDVYSINNEGAWRKVLLNDVWYVVGHKVLIPCSDEADADTILINLQIFSKEKADEETS